MRTLIERIRFKLRFKDTFPFVYDTETGEGIKPLNYSILADDIEYRTSRFGYVSGQYRTNRQTFVDDYRKPHWRPLT